MCLAHSRCFIYTTCSVITKQTETMPVQFPAVSLEPRTAPGMQQVLNNEGQS